MLRWLQMPTRMCPTCHQLHDKRWPCPTCGSKKKSPAARGIGPAHREFARIIKRDVLPCALCGQQYGDVTNPITVGHIIPRNEGGEDEFSNLRPECRRCNYGNR